MGTLVPSHYPAQRVLFPPNPNPQDLTSASDTDPLHTDGVAWAGEAACVADVCGCWTKTLLDVVEVVLVALIASASHKCRDGVDRLLVFGSRQDAPKRRPPFSTTGNRSATLLSTAKTHLPTSSPPATTAEEVFTGRHASVLAWGGCKYLNKPHLILYSLEVYSYEYLHTFFYQ